jgi:hypothetical protein
MEGVLAIRKTLVLGLGTTGREVAERLAEHLTWQFGGLERVAWVRLLVVETEQPASPLGDRVLWSGMKPEEYSQYITQPRTAGAEFGFYDWQDGPTLSKISNPATGAGNLRMLGRLCLLHPRTYNNLQMRVQRDVASLNQLTPQIVADRLGQPGLNVQIHTDTVVYVVGTLCGGTCSGGAADLGYLLDIWSNGNINRQAIFTVPHPGLARSESPRYKKNAYYALKELNHYQLSENPWVQKLPGYADPFVRNNVPYDILRVVMPGGPSGEDVQRLNSMIAQYLAAAVGPAGAEIAANDVNALNKMASTESLGFMRPLFSTVGVAALEYPGEHIQRAATSRLLAGMLSRWCRHQVDTDRFDNALRSLGGSDFDALLQKMTQGIDKVNGPNAEILRPAQDGTPPRADQVRQMVRDLDGRLQAMNPPQNGTGAAPGSAPTLVQVMQQNQDAFVQSIGREIARFLEQNLFTLDGGPGFVVEALKHYLRSMENWADAAQTNLPEQQQDARALRDILDHHVDELDRIQKSFNPMGKKEKLRHAWDAVSSSLQSYLEAETKTQTISHLQRHDYVREMIDQYRRVTVTLLRRLEQMQTAFSQTSADLERRWKEMAASSPSVNGRVYFQAEPPAPRGTVTEDYYNMLRQARWPEEPAAGWDDAEKEEAAQRDVLKALLPLAAELTRDDGSSAFDARPGIQSAKDSIPPQIMAAAETRARAVFAPLRTQTHIADKASDADINTVIMLSQPKLTVSATQVSDQLAGVRGVTPAQQDLAFTDVDSSSGGTNRPSIEALVQKIQNNMTLGRGQITDSDDPFRLLLIREKHGFTFGQMEGVVRANAHDLTSLQSAEYCNDFHFWHTRRDVDWVDPLIPPSRVEATEEAWLLVMLLGRPADGMLIWTPANKKEIEPEGWYNLVAGEFSVIYPPGMLDVSDREARLPLAFPDAVAKLLSPEYASLRRSLTMRFSSYRDKWGDDRVVRVLDTAIDALDVFGVQGLDRRRAERVVRRAYRRNDGLTRAFFNYRTENMEKGRSEFAHLRHMQGDPIPGKNTRFPADGYYCPDCNHPLGADVQQLMDAMFHCPACGGDERYWP